MISAIRRRPVAGLLGGGALVLVLTSLVAGGVDAWRQPLWSGGLVLWLGGLATVLGLGLLRFALARGAGVGAVAGVLIEETIRRKVALLSAGFLLGGIALLPTLLAANDVLEYRLRSFLGYGLFLAFFSLAILTVFGASASLCEEIVDRRIHLVVVKPTRRVQFLLGKWLGLIALDGLLLGVAGCALAGSLHLQLAAARADGEDVVAAESLLRVRRAISPEFPAELTDSLEERAIARRENDPESWIRLLAGVGGDEGAAFRELQREILREGVRQWRVVPAGESRTFVYRVPTTSSATLRLQPYLGREHASQRVRLVVTIGGDESVVFIGGGETSELEIPPSALTADSLAITIANPVEEGRPVRSANFLGRDGLRVEIDRGRFETNLIRALAILLLQLSFLAALGLCAGTFLGLPVAVLLVLLVLFAAVGGGVFLGEPAPERSPEVTHSPDDGHDHGHEHVGPSSFLTAVDRVGRGFVGIFAAWGRYPAITPVAEGLEIPREHLAGALLWIGLVWTGAVGCVGAWVFRRREIARVQV